MATVTFLQATNMSAFPTDWGGSYSGSSGPTEIDVHTQSRFNLFILGAFQITGPYSVGTITRVMIDDQDTHEFPNIDITGLSFTSNTGIQPRITSNPSQFVADLLAGDDVVTGTAGVDTLVGHDGNDKLDGGGEADAIKGGGGADTLIGGAGADTMLGGIGDDWYYVDSVGDLVIEVGGEGVADRVFASVSYTLGEGAEVEKLTTTNNAGTEAINLTGNGFVNTIFGNAGPNTLDGKGGADTLVGLGGDDWFYVDNAGDAVIEGAGEGAMDRVLASVNYTLGAGVQVEKLTTADNSGVSGLILIGNELDQSGGIYGNAGANYLKGMAGNDTLVGLGGADAFIFQTALNAATNVDYIVDFSHAQGDEIQLWSGIFSSLSAGTLGAGNFIAAADAADADDYIVYTGGGLYYDADGSGAGGKVLFAAVAGSPTLAAEDFYVL